MPLNDVRSMRVVVRTLFAIALFWLAFNVRSWAVAQPQNALSVGVLGAYDFDPAVSMATGYGYVDDSPANNAGVNLAGPVRSLARVSRAFEPERFMHRPYPPSLRLPGYSVLTWLNFKLTGTSSVQPLRDAQRILDSFLPMIVFLIVETFASVPIAVVASLCAVLWLPSAALAGSYYATSPLPFLVALSMLCALKGIAESSRRWLIGFAVLWIGILYLRPELMFVPILLCAAGGFMIERPLRLFVLIGLPAILIGGLSLWIVRNAVVFRKVGLTSGVGAVLWEGMGYPSGLFPEYNGYYDDSMPEKILLQHGIRIPDIPGSVFNGPKGMASSAALSKLFVRDVVRPHPVPLFFHFVYKLKTNYFGLHLFEEAAGRVFAPDKNARWRIVFGWIDEILLMLPFLVIVRAIIRPREAPLIAFLLAPIVGTHLSLMITVGGALRYITPVSACYLSIIAFLLQRRETTVAAQRSSAEQWLPAGVASIAGIVVFAVLGSQWPRANKNDPAANSAVVDLGRFPVAEARNVSSGTTLSLAPDRLAPRVNIGKGVRVSFVPPPYYDACTSPDDARQLTDGVVDETAHFATPPWVGWGSNATRARVAFRLDEPRVIDMIRIHTIQGAMTFPLDRVRVISETDYDLVADLRPPVTATRTAWVDVPVSRVLSSFYVELFAGALNDRYIFVDEIEVLGPAGYVSSGHLLTQSIRFLDHSRDRVPELIATVPEGSAAFLEFRQGSGAAMSRAWDPRRAGEPTQFRITLHASPGGMHTPEVRAIRLR